MKDAIEILIESRDRIKDTENWCQRYMACDSEGRAVAPYSSDAVRWCAYGSMSATWCSMSEEDREETDEYDTAMKEIKQQSKRVSGFAEYDIVFVIDCLGHAVVMSIYDESIQSLEELYMPEVEDEEQD